MAVKIALAGNPNCGKTTLFNALTGSNQFVGNWPGVTVEKKEGRLKGHKDVTIMDLPGIYSMSPYTNEEIVSRNFVLEDRPKAIINIMESFGVTLPANTGLSINLPLSAVAANEMEFSSRFWRRKRRARTLPSATSSPRSSPPTARSS